MPRSYNPLAEFLISLANPRNLRAYRQHPNAYLQRFGVGAADRAAIASASAAAIRRRARGAGSTLGTIGRRPVNSGISPKVNRSVGFTREFRRSRIFWLSSLEIETNP